MSADRFRYDGKKALVVGAATGMGAATVMLLADLGAEVHAVDVHEISAPVRAAHACDLRDRDAVDAMLASVGDGFNALFYCAGVAGRPFPPLDVLLVNMVAPRYVIEQAIDRGLVTRGGAIASISSIGDAGWQRELPLIAEVLATTDYDEGRNWAEKALEQRTVTDAYTFSKKVLSAYTMWRAATLLRDRGIRLNAIAPGPTATPLMPLFEEGARAAGLDFFEVFRSTTGQSYAEASDQAYPLVFLNSDAAGYVSGAVLPVDAGFLASLTAGAAESSTLRA